VFSRNPWKRNKAWPEGWEPNAYARGRTVKRGLSREAALALCAQGPANKLRDAGKEYRGKPFYEFERE
jgi:hypothetical protein